MMAQSIEAYDLPKRVESYDADMELMHPNRSKMVQIALDVLPFEKTSPIQAVDLGVGTGYFTERFLRQFPKSRVLAIDGAKSMIDLAKVRLGSLAARVDFRIGDFKNLYQLTRDAETIDAIFTSYALHHLNRSEKEALIRQAVNLLRPGGWFLNADIVVSDSPVIEQRVQQLRVEGIVKRADGRNQRFSDSASTRRFLAELEANESDQALMFSEDLAVLRDAGLRNSSAFWLEFRELVSGGQK
jgi:tRNA (cmo5U34)-methyltransferase